MIGRKNPSWMDTFNGMDKNFFGIIVKWQEPDTEFSLYHTALFAWDNFQFRYIGIG